MGGQNLRHYLDNVAKVVVEPGVAELLILLVNGNSKFFLQ